MKDHLDYRPEDVTFLADDHFSALLDKLTALAPGQRDNIEDVLFNTSGGVWPRSTADDPDPDLPADYHLGAALIAAVDRLTNGTDNTSLTDAQRREVLVLLKAANRAVPDHVREWSAAQTRSSAKEGVR